MTGLTGIDVDSLAAQGFPLADGRTLVPEPVVKRALAACGVTTPSGGTVTSADAAGDIPALTEPVVVKAFADGLVHKSDVGGVRLGVRREDVADAIGQISSSLRSAGFQPAGFLVEEQHSGVELIVGVVNRRDVGPVVLLGAGGTLTEILDDNVVRLCPLDEAGAREMLSSFSGAALLDGHRGAEPVDRDALVRLLLSIAGPGGFVERCGDRLSEFECNPVIVSAHGAVAADARLVLDPAPGGGEDLPPPAQADFDRLFLPRSIAVAGASTTRVAFGNRFLGSYRALGWDDGLYAIHPEASAIDGVPAVSSVAEIDGDVDYMMVAVPAARCADVIRSGAGKVRFAQVMSGGFREASAEGASLEAELLRAGRESGVRIVGPNCMGIYSPRGRQTFQLNDPTEPGHVSIASQSGGLAGDIIKGGAARGLRFSKVATIGNSIDVTPGELVRYYVDDPDTKVIGVYVEGMEDGRQLVSALRAARGHTPVVVLVGGLSRQGARAAASHTGSMTGDAKVWDAISAATGATVVRTLEQLLSALSLLQSQAELPVSGSPETMVVGPGGGASILSADAADRHGLLLAPVLDEVQKELRQRGYGAGTSIANPIEIPVGPGAPVDTFDPILDTILPRQTFPDVIVHINVHAFYSYGDKGAIPLVAVLEHLGSRARTTRLAVILRNLHVAPGGDRDTVVGVMFRLGLPFFTDFDEAMVAVAAAKRFARTRAV